ncbi:MAG: alpha-glucan family phosphorylase [Thermodesulfobacteriota bacterium]
MKIKTVYAIPKLPENLEKLRKLAMNYWFCWNWEAVYLFMRLGFIPQLGHRGNFWEDSYQNPILMLGRLPQDILYQVSKDESFLANLEDVYEKFSDYLRARTWFKEKHDKNENFLAAYFSSEYGIDEGLTIYSGGLGILSGDHLKAASDLGIPLVAVGILYQEGYFKQYLNLDGWQQECYPKNDWYNMPVILERDKSGKPILISIDYENTPVKAQIWRVEVGRVNLYLLDTNIPENSPDHRMITSQLYSGDRDIRIRQEMLLGIGGVRALEALGLNPTVYHMNEGHSAFLAMERIRSLMVKYNLRFFEAGEIVWASNVFSTHTPVPAGNEHFDPNLVKKYFNKFASDLGLSWNRFLSLGQEEPGKSPTFCMTVLALNLAAFCNGVSKLHGEISRNMWKKLWHTLPAKEIPITSITNGVHPRSWISHDLGDLFDRYLGPQFVEKPQDFGIWEGVDRIPDVELWRTHQIRKERLVFLARNLLKKQLVNRGASLTEAKIAQEALNPSTLTIGFARRFVAYKRSNLLFKNPDRLIKILTNPEMPVQIIYSGKAHPQDNDGKELIKSIIHFTQDHNLRNHIVFLEDYDINVGRYLVQGVDIWLNTPRRPLEASGTSGMKAAMNGAINLSVLDGWWCEGYQQDTGWAIGSGETYANPEEQDCIESESLYNLLEKEIIPLYYERDRVGLPREWIEKMKNSIKKIGAAFNTHRMLIEYTEKFYLPAGRAGENLLEDSALNAKNMAKWRKKLKERWPQIFLNTDKIVLEEEIYAGNKYPIRTRAHLGELTPDDVTVQIYYGLLDTSDQITDGQTVDMKPVEHTGGEYLYQTEISFPASGRYGFTARALPKHPGLVHPFTPLYITWE